MTKEAIWRLPGIFKADCQKVADEIESLGDNISPADLVNFARDDSTELHKCFEWDDTVAAEAYRQEQARRVIRLIVYKEPEKKEEDHQPIRIWVSSGENNRTYVPTKMVIQNDDSYQKLLKQAKAELDAFVRKYKTISELHELIEKIEEFI